MRVSLLPVLFAALAVITPIAAQDPNADPNAGADTTDTAVDTGATDTTTDNGNGQTDTNTDFGSPTETTTSDTSQQTDTGNTGSGDNVSGNPGISPSEPSGETVANIGSNIVAQWDITPDADQWTNMTIELMTGSNFNMVHLSTVGTGINAMNVSQYSFVAPSVHPTSKIYFLQFTNTGFTDKLWTTRFTIADRDGFTTPPTNNDTLADGSTYEWGVGALGASTVNGTTAPAPTAPAQTGVGPNGITLYTQGIETKTDYPLGALTGVAAATLGAKGPGGSGAGRAVATPAAVIGAVVAAAAFFA